MFELFRAGGIMMWPILLCSVAALAIVCERFWSLRSASVAPRNLFDQVQTLLHQQGLDERRMQALRHSSPLGRILAAGVASMASGREIMKESIEDVGRHVAHELERYLGMLGTIAAVSPLLGLLGTVIGMIKAFAAISAAGVGEPAVVASGIAEALITTAAGLFVAIPALIFHRYFRGRVSELIVNLELEALRLIEIAHGQRRPEGRIGGGIQRAS